MTDPQTDPIWQAATRLTTRQLSRLSGIQDAAYVAACREDFPAFCWTHAGAFASLEAAWAAFALWAGVGPGAETCSSESADDQRAR